MLEEKMPLEEPDGDTTIEPHTMLIMHGDSTATLQVCRTGRNPTMGTLGRAQGVSMRAMHDSLQGEMILHWDILFMITWLQISMAKLTQSAEEQSGSEFAAMLGLSHLAK